MYPVTKTFTVDISRTIMLWKSKKFDLLVIAICEITQDWVKALCAEISDPADWVVCESYTEGLDQFVAVLCSQVWSVQGRYKVVGNVGFTAWLKIKLQFYISTDIYMILSVVKYYSTVCTFKWCNHLYWTFKLHWEHSFLLFATLPSKWCLFVFV